MVKNVTKVFFLFFLLISSQASEFSCYDTAHNFYFKFPSELKWGDVIDIVDLAPFQKVTHIGAVYEDTSDHYLIVGEKPSGDHFLLKIYKNKQVPASNEFEQKTGLFAQYADDDFPLLDMACYELEGLE